MWGIWAIIALVLLIIEMFTIDFTFLMLAGGALGAMVMAFFAPSWPLQFSVFAVLAVLLLAFVRPFIKKCMNNSSGTRESNVYALIGKQATALTEITNLSGRAKVDGEEWSAKSSVGVLKEGSALIVTAVDGAHLVVAPE